MTHDEKVQFARMAIQRVFSDMDASPQQRARSLEELRKVIENELRVLPPADTGGAYADDLIKRAFRR